MQRLLISILISFFAVTCVSVGKPRVFYINSYDRGYPASDSVEAGIYEVLSHSVSLQSFYLNAKRLSGTSSDSMVKRALTAIKKFDPKLIIVSDDDAIKKVIVPYFRNSEIPVVFCGVNWSADAYDLSPLHTTGMLEVLPLAQTISVVRKYYPEGNKICILSENSISEQNNKKLLDTLYKRLGLEPEYLLVTSFADWKKAFLYANSEADLVYLPTNGAISDWNEKEAGEFVQANISKPVFTCDDFMMAYAVIGFTKVAKEQGLWAGQTALRILQGEKPAAIPVTVNQQQAGWINLLLADKIGFKPEPALLNVLQEVHNTIIH